MKIICTECKGNGFVRVPYEQVKEEIWANCDACNSQGEIDDRGPLDLTLRVEMLSKQKKILQDACRRAGKTIKSLENQLRTTIESTK